MNVPNALTQKDIDAIVRVFRETLLDIPEDCFDEWLAHWTADARLMPPSMADAVWHDELKDWMLSWPKVKRFDVIDTDVEGNGDLAVLIAHFVRVQEALDGRETKENGRQILKFRRQPDGQWLIAAAMFNADQP
jgi:ketosteroid isomerase-like protein